MDETPEEWLARLFEFEFCAECGGDAEDHEVCIVPGIGNYFARCLRGRGWPDHGDHATSEPPPTGLGHVTAASPVGRELLSACGRRHLRVRCEQHHTSEIGHDRVDRRSLLLRLP